MKTLNHTFYIGTFKTHAFTGKKFAVFDQSPVVQGYRDFVFALSLAESFHPFELGRQVRGLLNAS